MAQRTRLVYWNGKDLPPEFRDLPAGRYLVEAVDGEAPVLGPAEEAGIEAALESYRQGRLVEAKRLSSASSAWRLASMRMCE